MLMIIDPTIVIGGAFGAVVFLMVLYFIVKAFYKIGLPNQVLILSGRDMQLEDGRSVGYRYGIGKRMFMIPVLEKLQFMDLRNISVNIHTQGAYSKGGIPLDVHAIANVKISSDPARIHNAIERFMGRDRSEIMRVAQETLEGNLRGILATLTPEEVNEDRQTFISEILEDVDPDFRKLGLQLDTLKIQNVSDGRDYLDSIGRKRIAEIIKEAEIAESNAMKIAEEIEAEAQGQSEVARKNAQAKIQTAQNDLRQVSAIQELAAKSEEEKAQALALAARAEQEQELQLVRTKLEDIRLKADVVIPAEVEKIAREYIAAGEAAEISERGRAMAEVLKMTSEVWLEAGDAAMDIFLLQNIEKIMNRVAEAARQVQVREVAIIDGGDGQALPNYVASFPRIVASLFAEMRDTMGIDIGQALTGQNVEMVETIWAKDPSTASPELARKELSSRPASPQLASNFAQDAFKTDEARMPSLAGLTTPSIQAPKAPGSLFTPADDASDD